MADGQYLSKADGRKQLEARPFDFQLWELLEQFIKDGAGKQNRTAARIKK